MVFLADVFVPCEQCDGRRFKQQVLDVKYRNKSITQVLDMTVREALTFFGGSPKVLRRLQVLDEIGLGYLRLGQPATTLSGGEAQRIKIAAHLATGGGERLLYILDEPTSGLDPLMEAIFQDCILTAKAEGRTVLLSSHILAEVEKICDRVTIIRHGRAVQSGTLTELRHLTRTTISAQTSTPASEMGSMPGVHDLMVEGDNVTFDVDSDHLDEVMRRLSALGLRSLTSHPPTLEELFLRHYGDELDNGTSVSDETLEEAPRGSSHRPTPR